MTARSRLRVFIERGQQRVFAGALDWPGWARSAKSEQEAIERLLQYAPRYARALRPLKLSKAPPSDDVEVEVMERHAGGGGTDFGVAGADLKGDRDPLSAAELRRQRAILEASWKAFDAAARRAGGKTLSVGPRGGGRTLAKMAGHVLEAEVAYVGQLGSRHAKPPAGRDELAHVRAEALATLDAVVHGRPIPNPRNTKRPWTPRYFIRRSAWHSLDHAWELEDRTPG